MKYAILGIKAFLTLAFVAAGVAKFAGVDEVVLSFERIGVGMWFLYLTATIEIFGAVLLWLPGRTAYGAALLTATMVGAAIYHIVFPPIADIVPALVLGVLSAFILWTHRDQLAGRPTAA